MAIKLNLAKSNYGIPFTGAYFRIVTAAVSRQRGATFSVMIDVVGYAAKPIDEDTKDVDFRRYHVPLADIENAAGTAFFAKCYAWVMAQPDMSGSVEV